MNRKNRSKSSSDAELDEALNYLRDLQEQLSFGAISAMLKNVDGVGKLNRVTVWRWLEQDKQSLRPKTRAQIIKAAAGLKAYQARPTTITAGVVTAATDMLPVLMLQALPSLREKEGTKGGGSDKAVERLKSGQGVRVDIEPNESIDQLLALLEDGRLDFVAAPRNANGEVEDDEEEDLDESKPFPSVKRLFKIAEVEVCGLFSAIPRRPGAMPPSRRDLAEQLQEMAKDPKCYVGVLANGDYERALRKLAGEDTPHTDLVSGSRDAVKKLKAGEIQGVVGHRLMITNTHALVRMELEERKAEAPNIFKELEIFGQNMFVPAKMDIWVNPGEMKNKPGLGGKVFHLLCEAMDQIKQRQRTPAFTKLVNELLQLDALKEYVEEEFGRKYVDEIRDGDQLFREYRKQYTFGIKTFVTKTMRQLWI